MFSKKNNKKLNLIILFCILLTIIFTGCSNKSQNDEFSGVAVDENISFPDSIIEESKIQDNVTKSINDGVKLINLTSVQDVLNNKNISVENSISDETGETKIVAGQFGYVAGSYHINYNKENNEINSVCFYSNLSQKETDIDVELTDEQVKEIRNNIINFYNSFIHSQNAQLVSASYYKVNDDDRTTVDVENFKIEDLASVFSQKQNTENHVLNYVLIFVSEDDVPTEIMFSTAWFGTISISVTGFRQNIQ